ncbi:unnamed protein product [Effrenium voratum]|uniref:NADP-dependent oxidoreductase domain-containing protein n=1 Tax=Effrenium voratum TaxID=2562239 RepID=A0AA36IVS3_9DINO|nr:unnamed protein product [Effrenium voratum]
MAPAMRSSVLRCAVLLPLAGVLNWSFSTPLEHKMAARGREEIPSCLRRSLALAPLLFGPLGPSEVRAEGLRVAGSEKLMPRIGYGTCCRPTSRGEPLIQGVKAYLAAGGRLIDTAQVYGNHLDIAEAIRQSGVPRDELWVTSKVKVQNCYTPKDVVQAVATSLEQLDLSYLDLMLLHGGDGWGIDPRRDLRLWRGLQDAQQAGTVHSIGLSNHNQEEIERLISKTGVKPAVNQLEFHPWVPEETKDLVKWCQNTGIVVTAYGSLGGSSNQARGEVVSQVAKKYGKTNAQVLLRWALDQQVAVIPGASSEQHIREDLDLEGFQLSPQDLAQLTAAEMPPRFTRWRNCNQGCAA